MTVASRPPRVHRGSSLPPGVPPPKKGELHMRVEGFEWQNTAFEARPPAYCSLLISWWGQASYNSLLMPLSASLAFSPATAVFSLHCSPKHFERYLQDMGFLELTLVDGNSTFDLKDISRTMLGKLSVSVSNLAEGHPVHGSYPIFANGHRLIGSITLGTTVTFYNRAADADVGQSVGESIRCQTDARCENAKPHSVSSFERNEELASGDSTLPLYPPAPFAGPLRQPKRGDVNVNPYLVPDPEWSSGSPPLNRGVKLDKHSIGGHKNSILEEAVQQIVNKRLARTKSSFSSEPATTASRLRDAVDFSPLQQHNETNGAHFRSRNPYLDPSFAELEGLDIEKADSLCGSDDSSLSCIISKSERLIKSLACESGKQGNLTSINLPWREMALKDSNRLKDLGMKGSNGSINSMLDNGHDFSTIPRKAPLEADKLDNPCLNTQYASILERCTKNNKDVRSICAEQPINLSTTESKRSLEDILKDSGVDAVGGYQEHKPQRILRVPQAMQLYADEAKRGGLPDLLVPSPSTTFGCTNNSSGNPAFTANTNTRSGKTDIDEEQVAQEVKPTDTSLNRNGSVPVRTTSSGTHPPLIPKVDFGFDPGGEQQSSIPSISILTQTSRANLVRADPSDSCNLEGRSASPMQRSFEPKTSFGIESGKTKLSSSFSSPQAVIDDLKQLIKRAEACRDTLKKPEFSNMRPMTSTTIPSAESSRLSRSHGHLYGLYSSADDLLDNILAANKKGRDVELTTEVLKHEEEIFDPADDLYASDVVKAALLEGLYMDNKVKALNISSDVVVEPARSEASFGAIQHKIEAARREGDWYDHYLKSNDGGLKNPIYWPDEDTLNPSKYDDVRPSYGHIPAQKVDFPGSEHGQPFTLRVTIGKLVLCGPMVMDLADPRPSRGPIHSLGSTLHPTCTCSLTVSFPALTPPYSSKQRICISPVSFGTREAVFDHQSQLCWNILPGHNLQDWQSRDLRVTVLLTWLRFDNLECAGYVSLEKVAASMPGVYRTSLALALTSHPAHKRSRSNSPRRRRSLKVCEKQKLEPGRKQLAGSRINCAENLERFSSPRKDAVARVDVMLQLSHSCSLSANKSERFSGTQKTPVSRPWRGNRMKPSPPRVLTNFAPALGNSQDWWLHIILYDVVNCFGDLLSSSHYSSKERVRAPHLLLVVKSGPELSVQVPFPMKCGLHNQNLGNSANAVLRAPVQLLETRKAIMFIEVWHDAGVVNKASKELEPLVGLIKVPLSVVSGILSPTEDSRRIFAKGGEVVGDGLHQVYDPLNCTAVGTVMVVVTLGLSYQMHRLRKANRAAVLIQRHVREFLARELEPGKSIHITRFWDTGN